jgi:hypothetical protein
MPAANLALKASSAAAHASPEASTTVKVTTALVWSGTFTVHAKHALDFSSGSHQYSILPFIEDDLSLEEVVGLPRLSDAVHLMEFVGEGQHYA